MQVEHSTLNVVAVGASAGGVEALTNFASGLPAGLPCAIVVVLHMHIGAPSVLARILDRNGPLPAVTATPGARLEHGRIYVATPGRHLLVRAGEIMLTEGPTENGHRPAINALFRSVAVAHGRRAVGVVLSGVLDDGVLGSAAIRSRGGTVVAQAPTDALFAEMPRSAIDAGVVDHQRAAAEMGDLLKRLASREFDEAGMEPDPRLEVENQIAMAGWFSTDFDAGVLGPLSGYTCPDCSGALVAVSEGNYRCHVGHAWTADALLGTRNDEVERALWVAMRSLQEGAKLSRRLAGKVSEGLLSTRYHALAEEAEHATSVLGRRLKTLHGEGGGPP